MSASSPRWPAALFGLVLAAPLLWFALPALRGTHELLAIERLDPDSALRRVLADREEGGEPIGHFLPRHRLSVEAVRAAMPLSTPRRTYDPFCYFIYRPGRILRGGFPDHPLKVWKRPVNDLGLRDSENWRTNGDPHVLVTGDSHIDGVCTEEETLPSRLEELLSEQGHEVQVLNAAHGAYGFFHYVGVLERFLHLGLVPDVFVMVVYSGNDFAAAPPLRALFDGRRPPLPPRDRLLARNAALDARRYEMGQAGNSLEFFAARPDQGDVALQVAGTAALEARAMCEENGIQFLVAYLPSALELGSGTDLSGSMEMMKILERGPEDVALLGRIGDDFLAFLAKEEIEHVDFRGGFLTAEEPLYWSRDLHLAPAGHALGAELTLPLLTDLLRGD